jgi:uncharacterized protein YxjI
MRFHIKERAWTLREQMTVKDQNGQPVFHVKGKFFHISDNLILTDHSSGEELAHIKQQLLKFTPHYEIQRKNAYKAHLHENFFHLGGDRFKVKLDNGSTLHIDGDLFNWDFTINDENNNLWAQVNRRLSLFSDSYAVETAQDVDVPFVIALTITIEMIRKHEEEKKK